MHKPKPKSGKAAPKFAAPKPWACHKSPKKPGQTGEAAMNKVEIQKKRSASQNSKLNPHDTRPKQSSRASDEAFSKAEPRKQRTSTKHPNSHMAHRQPVTKPEGRSAPVTPALLPEGESGFAGLGVSGEHCFALQQAGIDVPTEIQAQAIPVAMEGHDLIGIAKTGTGKTLAFALPIIKRLQEGQQALVIAPTRELADQIEETFDNLGVRCSLIIGGAGMHKQVSDLRRNPQVIIATPGRLLDHMERGSARLKNVAFVVLDEADRMLDMGFAPGIKRIMSAVPEERQTMLFSATMPKTIEEMAATYLKRPQRVEVSPQGTASELVQQELIYVPFGEKNPMLVHLVTENRGSVLVFARTRHGARKLAKMLRHEGHSAAEIHSDRTLAQRREALYGFKSGQYRVLVATDIAARGIDVKEISVVINFDVPENPEDYVHRIGRTGRAGAPGRSITLALEEQVRDIFDIEKLLGHELPVSKRSTITPPRAMFKSARKPKVPVATHDHESKPTGPFARYQHPGQRKRSKSRRPH